MLRSTSPVDTKALLEQDYDSEEEAKIAEAEAQALSQATNAPRINSAGLQMRSPVRL